MPMSFYQLSIPILRHALVNMGTCLDKGAAWATEKGVSEADLLAMRLAPDMHPLSRQYQMASDAAKGAAGRLADVEVPSMADSETTVAELKDRLARTIAFLDSIDPASVDGREDADILMKLPGAEIHFKALGHVQTFVMPNVFFHASMAYALLRHAGVPIGKMDYLGAVDIVRTPAAA
jgi:hypothetical protein